MSETLHYASEGRIPLESHVYGPLTKERLIALEKARAWERIGDEISKNATCKQGFWQIQVKEDELNVRVRIDVKHAPKAIYDHELSLTALRNKNNALRAKIQRRDATISALRAKLLIARGESDDLQP